MYEKSISNQLGQDDYQKPLIKTPRPPLSVLCNTQLLLKIWLKDVIPQILKRFYLIWIFSSCKIYNHCWVIVIQKNTLDCNHFLISLSVISVEYLTNPSWASSWDMFHGRYNFLVRDTMTFLVKSSKEWIIFSRFPTGKGKCNHWKYEWDMLNNHFLKCVCRAETQTMNYIVNIAYCTLFRGSSWSSFNWRGRFVLLRNNMMREIHFNNRTCTILLCFYNCPFTF